MRRCYFVCYDIRDSKRLRRVYKTMKGYGEHWQYSVFLCVLKDIDRVRMQSEIEDVINHKQDQVMIIDLGPDEANVRNSTTVIGQSLPEQETGTIIV